MKIQSFIFVLCLFPTCAGGDVYALLINGGGEGGSMAYARDIQCAYNVVTDAQHIEVFQTDGLNPEADAGYLLGWWAGQSYQFTNPFRSSPTGLNPKTASTENINTAFESLSQTMTTNDDLIVIVTDHGHYQTGGIYLWHEVWLPEDVINAINLVTDYRHELIVLSECYAEAFVPYIIKPRRTIVYSDGVVIEKDEIVYLGGDMDGLVIPGYTPWLTLFLSNLNYGRKISDAYQYAQSHDPYGSVLGPGWKDIYPGGPGDWCLESFRFVGDDWRWMALPGDADLDGDIDIFDFMTLQGNYGLSGQWEQGDFNGDGIVNIFDFMDIQADFGRDRSALVPEPSLGVLMLLGGYFVAIQNNKSSRFNGAVPVKGRK